MSSPAISKPGLDHVLDRHALLAEMLLQRKALARRIAEPEFQLRRGIERRGRRDSRAPWRRRAPPTSPRRISPQAPSTSCSVLRLSSRASSSLENFGSGTPAMLRQPLDRLGERDALGLHHEIENVAVLAGGEVEPRRFWSLTKNEGVFSLLKGDRPFHSRPASSASRAGPRPPKPEGGRAARRGIGAEKRMVIRKVSP